MYIEILVVIVVLCAMETTANCFQVTSECITTFLVSLENLQAHDPALEFDLFPLSAFERQDQPSVGPLSSTFIAAIDLALGPRVKGDVAYPRSQIGTTYPAGA